MSDQTINVVEFTDVEESSPTGETIVNNDLSIIDSLEVELTVDLGSACMTVGELYQLKMGQIVKLDSLVDQPLKLLLGDKQVAEGTLVAVEDNFGIELTKVANIG